jgi:hypothetical protein
MNPRCSLPAHPAPDRSTAPSPRPCPVRWERESAFPRRTGAGLPALRAAKLLLFSVLLLARAQAQETLHLYLSGHGKDDAVPWRFMCSSGAQSGYWTNLPVPSQWDMHGFGTLRYHKDATNAWGETGVYEHDFVVPADWTGRRVFLTFEGVMTDTAASINGRSVGPIHQGGFYRFSYEVTRLLKFGATNRLEVTVAKHSADNSVNRAERLADYWVFGGIYRPVHLDAVPPQFIQRVAVDARADGNFAMDVYVNGSGRADAVEAQMTTLDGRPAGGVFSARLPAPDRSDRQRVELRTRIASPRTWTAETPNLYQVEVRLMQGSRVLHRYHQRFGFRTMEVRAGDGLYVNGRKVVLKGVNRHSFWPDSGRCLSEAVHRLDIETMKDMNLNAVRMSHYPPDAEFLDLCDELGLYVLDELAGWHNCYDTGIGTKLVEEMVTRDVNHPCILFWDNGNEGGFNTNLDAVFPEYDPQHRHVLHPWAIFGGLNTGHYNRYEEARAFCASNTIYMPTEFQHGLFDGGAGAGLHDYWSVMGRSPICAGGFIWAFTDDGVKRPDTGEIDVAGNQAPDGIVGPYRQREGSFYAIKQIWSPIQVRPGTNGTVTVENHYNFTDANQCRFTWQLRCMPGPEVSTSGYRILSQTAVAAPSIPPGTTGTLPTCPYFGVPEAAGNCVELIALRVDDPAGRELWTWVWPRDFRGRMPYPIRETGAHQADADETADSVLLSVGALTVRIGKDTGFLADVTRGDQHFSLVNGPRPAVGEAKLVAIELVQDGSDQVVKAKYEGDLKSVTWRLRGSGWLKCDYTYSASGTQDYFGVLFDYPEHLVNRKRWLGEGPYRVWKNRLAGGALNVWQTDYNNTITGWRDWIYPEFKGCFARVSWLQLDTSEGAITVVPEASIPFVQVLTPELPPEKLRGHATAELPRAGLGFLDGIPPIGSKFKEAKTTGPQGQPNTPHGEYSGSVSFYFGKLP